MFTPQLLEAINRSGLSGLDDLARVLWKAYGNGLICDSDADLLGVLLEDRRKALREGLEAPPKRPPLSRTLYPPRRAQRSPDRERSRIRRRTHAASGVMPPRLAALFTTGELSVLTIIASEAGIDGMCDCSINEIAARSGVTRTTVQNAVRQAEKHGLLFMQERRRPRRPSLTNLVRIVSEEWKLWLKHGAAKAKKAKQARSLKKQEFFLENRGFKKLMCSVKPTVNLKGQAYKFASKRPYRPPTAVA